MSQKLDLATLFASIAQELDVDRTQLNELDGRNGNAGDNLANNFRLVSEILAQQKGKTDDRTALKQAAQVLQTQGRGKTADLYASGLSEAAAKLPAGSLSINDLLPLLEGLMRGVQQSSNAKQGDGTLLDALIPGVLGYMQAKQRGASDMEAILDALASSRRGAYGNSASSGATSQAPAQADPGAVGVGSLLEGLFRGLLKSGVIGGGNIYSESPSNKQV
jgi:Dihydroxyacetone kinase